jgi:hypothetical protein
MPVAGYRRVDEGENIQVRTTRVGMFLQKLIEIPAAKIIEYEFATERPGRSPADRGIRVG